MAGPLIRRGALFVGTLVVLLVLLALAYGARVAWAAHNGVAGTDGTRTGIPVDAPVTIARDERDVPHIRAGSVHDLMVADGYAMGSDRLFQMDLSRRYVDGRLAELLGAPVVRTDRRMRRYGIRELAARVLAAVASVRDAARGHEAICVSHQLPIWTARQQVAGKDRIVADRPHPSLCIDSSVVHDPSVAPETGECASALGAK